LIRILETMMGLDQPLSVAVSVFTDVSLASFAVPTRTETDIASEMAAHLRALKPGSNAEALRALRRAFPNSPLTARVLALGALMRR